MRGLLRDDQYHSAPLQNIYREGAALPHFIGGDHSAPSIYRGGTPPPQILSVEQSAEGRICCKPRKRWPLRSKKL